MEKVEEAQYLLGKIYHFDLEETDNGVVEFQSHIDRFKNSRHRPEILYMLYLICSEKTSCNAEEYAVLEKQDYPNSIYAKLISNPNYVKDNEGRNKEVHALYEQAFNLYNQDQYVRSRQVIQKTISSYPKNDILDNLELLNAMTYAKTDQLNKYVFYLKKFTKDHNTSDLLPHVNILLKRLHESVDVSSLVAVDDTSFVQSTDSLKYLIALFEYKTISPEKVKSVFWEFNDTYFPLESFKDTHLDFSDTTFLLSVRTFKNDTQRKEYMKKFNHFLEFRNHFENLKFEPYFISKRNYQILLNTKNLARFSEFEEENK
jgi:outer membrane protein assembly factor BamD (BamD/ComL family)